MEQLKKLVNEINGKFVDFSRDAEANTNGNKAAGVRARKASLEIEKLLKQYRKDSIEATKL